MAGWIVAVALCIVLAAVAGAPWWGIVIVALFCAIVALLCLVGSMGWR